MLDKGKVFAIVAAAAVGLALWNSPVVYPLKLLTVLLHEVGHAIAATLVGGQVVSISINHLQGGLARAHLQPTFFNQIAFGSAGYLGSALAGAILMLVSLRRGSGKLVLGGLAAFLLLVLALWARSAFTLLVGLGMVLALGLGARWLSRGPSQLAATFIATFVGLYALFDLRDDLWSAARRRGTDAAILADATGIPSLLWAALWSLIAIALLGGAIYVGTRTRRRAPLPLAKR